MAANVKHFRPGELLFREGEAAKALYIIQKGSVSIRKRTRGGFIELGKVFTNEVIGELAFFDHSARSASAVAITDVDAMEVDYVALEKVYKAVPAYFQTMMASIAERLRRADEVIRRLKKHADISGSEATKESEELEEAEEAPEPSAADVLQATADDTLEQQVLSEIEAQSSGPGGKQDR